MDEFQKMRIMVATILTAGFNAAFDKTSACDVDNVNRGLNQADDLLSKCGQVDPNQS